MIQLSRRTVALALAAFLAVAGLATASFVRTLAPAEANHRFPDVATGTFFHESSGAIFDAGCADGYSDGTFRPKTNANRGQFGYWTHNCASRATHASTLPGATGIPFTLGPEVTISNVTMQVGPTTNAQKNQFVHLTGTMTVYSNSTLATYCQADAKLYEGATLLQSGSARLVGAIPSSSIAVDVVVPATLGSHTYTMKVDGSGTDCTGANAFNNGLTAVTSTFGKTGGNTESADGEAAPRADNASPPAPPAG
jgi:hypothetical protein